MKKKLFLFFLLIVPVQSYSQQENMVVVPEGKYKNSYTQKLVQIKSFFMDIYEVTIADFDLFVKETNYVTDAEKRGFSIYLKDTIYNANYKCDPKGVIRNKEDYNYPVMHVSYNDAESYAKWAGKRLPTELEWMYVAESDKLGNPNNRAWFYENSIKEDGSLDAHPVGLKKKNNLGVFDLFGNVAEYTSSKYMNDRGHIVKGGNFFDDIDFYKRKKPGDRQLVVSSSSYSCFGIGFRCVKDL